MADLTYAMNLDEDEITLLIQSMSDVLFGNEVQRPYARLLLSICPGMTTQEAQSELQHTGIQTSNHRKITTVVAKLQKSATLHGNTQQSGRRPRAGKAEGL
jgi:hypothetical protein